MNDIAPVLLLIYNRPEITRRTLNQIRKIGPKHLFIAADGPLDSKPDDKILCEQTRNIVGEIDWECEIKQLFHEKNLGLRNAVSTAITWFFENVQEGIILEDDCVPSESFFTFTTEMLREYREDTRIFSISGTNYHNITNRIDGSYYFSKYVSSHGWATWRECWKMYNEFKNWDEIKKSTILNSLFPDKIEKEYWITIFDKVQDKIIDSWAYIWTYSCLINYGLNIVPKRNLVKNIGHGVSATHTIAEESPVFKLDSFELDEIIHPLTIIPDFYLDKELFYKYHLTKELRKKSTFFGRFQLILSKKFKWLKRQIKKRLI